MRECDFGLCRTRGVNAAERCRFFDALAGFGDCVHAAIIINFGFFRESPAAEVANDFANDARVAFCDETRYSQPSTPKPRMRWNRDESFLLKAFKSVP